MSTLVTGNQDLDRAQQQQSKDLERAVAHPMASGQLHLNQRTVLSNANIGTGDVVVNYAGPGGHTLVLPKSSGAAGRAQMIWIANIGTGNAGPLKVVPQAGDTVNGAASLLLGAGQSALVVLNG